MNRFGTLLFFVAACSSVTYAAVLAESQDRQAITTIDSYGAPVADPLNYPTGQATVGQEWQTVTSWDSTSSVPATSYAYGNGNVQPQYTGLSGGVNVDLGLKSKTLRILELIVIGMGLLQAYRIVKDLIDAGKFKRFC